MLEVIISAIMSFIGTNIDDLFVDTIFFSGVARSRFAALSSGNIWG